MSIKYSQIVVLVISNIFAEACQPPPCHWSDATPFLNYFDGLANTLIAADRRAQQLCYNSGSRSSKEIFGKEFVYVFPVERYHVGDFSVMIKDRLLFVHGNSCEKIFAEVRIIPDFLNVYGAYWVYENEEVVVYFPYTFNRNVGKVYQQCLPPNSQVITVQKRESSGEIVGKYK